MLIFENYIVSVLCDWVCTPYQDIVWFDVSMEDVASFEQLKGQKELLTIGAYSLDVETNIFAVLLQHLSQIHTTDDNITRI